MFWKSHAKWDTGTWTQVNIKEKSWLVHCSLGTHLETGLWFLGFLNISSPRCQEKWLWTVWGQAGRKTCWEVCNFRMHYRSALASHRGRGLTKPCKDFWCCNNLPSVLTFFFSSFFSSKNVEKMTGSHLCQCLRTQISLNEAERWREEGPSDMVLSSTSSCASSQP